MNKKTKNYSKAVVSFVCVMCLVVGFMLGVVGYYFYDLSNNDIFKSDDVSDFSIHVLELGNGYTGDSIYIKCGETDILVDAGSKPESYSTISNYLNKYISDNIIEFVIATHADEDHIAAFAGDSKNASLFSLYEVKTIIDFPKTNKNTAVYNRYIENRNKEIENGANHFTALECYNEQNGGKRSYILSDGITLNILYNYYYETSSSSENNYSVCFEIVSGEKRYLFTGDLEKSGEQKLVEYNNLGQVEFFKAGHHGSNTSSCEVLLEVIKPKIIAVPCVAGSVEYTQNLSNTFPTQEFINRIAKYTTKVFVTSWAKVEKVDDRHVNTSYGSLNGTIILTAMGSTTTVVGSENSDELKNSSWFNAERKLPKEWVA